MSTSGVGNAINGKKYSEKHVLLRLEFFGTEILPGERQTESQHDMQTDASFPKSNANFEEPTKNTLICQTCAGKQHLLMQGESIGPTAELPSNNGLFSRNRSL